MSLSLLLATLVGCGESGGATLTDGASSTPDTTTPGTTANEPTTVESTDGTASASEASTSTSEGATVASTAEPTTGSATSGETTGETTGDTTDATTGDTTGDTTGGSSPLVIAVVDAYLFANCRPVVDPDPVQGSWYVEFDNTGNPNDTSAVVTAASLSLADADPPAIEPIMVAPVESGPIAAGDYVSVKVGKLPGAMHSACGHCDEFYKLVLEYDEGGVSHHVEEDVTISCAF